MKIVQVHIMGEKWEINECSIDEESRFEYCDGFCDWTTRRIFVRSELEGTLEDMDVYLKKVLRHEIVHAFLFESGLAESSLPSEEWAKNEEMIDWIARNGEKIYNVWKIAGAVTG